MAPTRDLEAPTGVAPPMHPSRMNLVDINRAGPGMAMHPSRMGLVDINRQNPKMHPSRMGMVDINRENPKMMHNREDPNMVGSPSGMVEVSWSNPNPQAQVNTIAEPIEAPKEPCPPEPGMEDNGGEATEQDPNWFFMSLGRPEGPVTWSELWEKCSGTGILVFRKGLKDWMSIYDVLNTPTADEVFYYKDANGEECGPTTKGKVLLMNDSTEVWKKGWESWSTVGKLKTLKSVEAEVAVEKSESASTFELGSYVEIKDISHVYKTINRSTFLDPWPEIDNLKSTEVKTQAGQDYWKKIGLEIKTGFQGEVIFKWNTYGCETRLVKISLEGNNALVPVKVEGLKLVKKEQQSKKRARDDNDSSNQGKATQEWQEAMNRVDSAKKPRVEKGDAGGFSSWLDKEGY